MFCFMAVFGTMFLSDSLLSRIRFRLLLIRFFFTCLVISRVSPVPGHTFHTYRSPYTGGFSLVLFQFLPNFHGLRPIEQGSTSSFLLLLREALFTIRQDSLYVAVCMIVSASYEAYITHPLSTLYYYNAPDLTIWLTGDYHNRTYTDWCAPALLGTLLLHKKRPEKPTSSSQFIFAILLLQKLL